MQIIIQIQIISDGNTDNNTDNHTENHTDNHTEKHIVQPRSCPSVSPKAETLGVGVGGGGGPPQLSLYVPIGESLSKDAFQRCFDVRTDESNGAQMRPRCGWKNESRA
jgi:hypothetical protein